MNIIRQKKLAHYSERNALNDVSISLRWVLTASHTVFGIALHES